jgi:5'-3' exonuclease
MSSEPTTQGDKANSQTLVLIDGHALAYRAYFALANTGFQPQTIR